MEDSFSIAIVSFTLKVIVIFYVIFIHEIRIINQLIR